MFHSSAMGWKSDADLIVVGSGIGGLAAAITAHELGLRVILVEKAGKLGGVSAYSGGEVFVPANHLSAGDSLDAGRAYFRFLGAGYADAALQENLVARAPEVARWFG